MKFGFLSHLDINLALFRAPIMHALIADGHRVYAICPKGDKNKFLIDIGCEVVNYEIERQGLNPFAEKKAINNIYEAIKDLQLDVLHTFTAKPNIYGTKAGKKANVPVILNLVEGLGSFYVKETLKNILIRNLMEYLYKKTFQVSSGCVFVNHSDPTYMIEKKIIKKDKVKVIKSVGLDTEKFSMFKYDDQRLSEIRNSLDIDDQTVILMVARAIGDKGVREYYEAARQVSQNHSKVKFVLVGGLDAGNHSNMTQEYLESSPYVKWLGHRDDIPDITAISDIYVLPSYREGLPVTLMEACAMGKPIVTTDTFGCRDVVDDGVNGMLVPIKDSQALASAIEYLIINKEKRIQMGTAGRKIAEHEFDVRKVVVQYMEYYEKFI